MSGNVLIQGKLDTDRTIVQEVYADSNGRLLTSGLDFFLEVAKGNIPGHSFVVVQGSTDTTQTTFTDIWGTTSNFVYPTANETWEIVSSSANDTAAGTGGRTGILVSLDENYIEQTTPFTLNGTTAVVLANSHFRPQEVIILTGGSLSTNDGTVTVRVSGAGAPRAVIPVNKGRNFDTQYTVPAGKSILVLQTFTVFEKNFDGEFHVRIRGSEADSSWINNVSSPLYQNALPFSIKAFGAISEKSDLSVQAKTTSSGATIAHIIEMVLVENPL